MQRFARDAAVLVVLFAAITALPIIWAYSAGIVPPLSDWQRWGVWRMLAISGVGDAVMLGLNLWGMRKGEFRWYRDGVATLVIVLILMLILLPTVGPGPERA